jgi:hypothetical protein
MNRQENEMPWIIPALELKLADGSTLVKPLKAVRRGTASQVAKWTGMSTKTLGRLADAGLITRAKGTPVLHFYFPGEVEALIQATIDDPDWWTPERKRLYFEAREIREIKDNAKIQP